MADRAKPRRKRRQVKLRGAPLQFERQLYQIFRRVVVFWQGRIRDLEPPYRVADAMPTPEQVMSEQEEANRLLLVLIGQIQEWAQESGKWVRSLWVGRIKYEFGVDIDLLAENQANHEQLRAAIEWASALVRDLSDATRNKLAGSLAQSIASGASHEEVARAVRDVIKSSDTRARLIARDQTQKIFSKLAELQAREAGSDEYVWNHSFQPNPRRHHVERQGNTYRWDRPPRDGHPGTAVNCRCSASPVV